LSNAARVLMLGLDAADHGMVQDLARDGRLPNLASLADTGVSGRLDSPAALYAGGVWPSFYTGRNVPSHGVFHNKQWRPETMRVEVPTDEWTSSRPFWEDWRGSDIDTVIVDVPMVLGRPRPLHGVYVGGWGTHDLISRGSWPKPVWRDLERGFGVPLMPVEHFGQQTDDSLSDLSAILQRSTSQMRDVAIDLLERHPWRFACIVFGAAHRAGHYLWDRSQVARRTKRGADTHAPCRDLLEIYESLDTAVGDVTRHAPDGTLVIVFAVHGMGPNPGWSDLFPTILASLDQHRTGRRPRRGWLYQFKQAVPHHWVRPLLRALPTAATNRLVELWSRRMHDWSATRYFPMPMDEAGYVRINLRGREREGIVADGAEYDEACAEVETLVASLRDEATGQPIAGAALRAYRDAGPLESGRRLVPDLIFPWTGPPAATTKRIVSSVLPDFKFEVPALLPSGRSGNHTGQGWFIASGPGIHAGTRVDGYGVIDLLPTIYGSLGCEMDPQLPGRPIIEIIGK
jgi:predicted AlkP superfamily phosphohydrolase/phosphomutase